MLTSRLQIQMIADLLAGLEESDLRPRDFAEPLRAAYQAVLQAPPGTKQQALIRALEGHPDRDSVIGAIIAAVPGTRLDFPALSEIADTLPPITWLWPDWIPVGLITLLGSVPGAGKSYLALDLARRVISGEPFPDGSLVPRSGASVVYVDAELVPQIISERAQLWHMDISRFYLMSPQDRSFVDFGQQADRDNLIEMVHRLDPALIVVDSLSSISCKGENSVEDVRDVLGFLNTLAQDAHCGLLLIHHLRKRGPLPFANALGIDDFRGSGHIVAMSRSVLGLSVVQTGPEPDRNGPRRLEVIKTNLARYPAPIGVDFLPQHPKGVVLKYGTSPEQYRKPMKVDQCVDWLLQTLEEAGEPTKPGDVVELATEAGFGRATVYRARKALGEKIRNTEGRRCPGNMWEVV
jgi:hypothetical protein